jgi:YHS domain-containing protein
MQPTLRLAWTFLLLSCPALAADPPPRRTPKEALQPLNDLVGVWNATGEPEGSRAAKQKGFWKETVSWEWQFKGDDAWLKLTIDKGKYFTGGELRYLPDTDRYQLALRTLGKEERIFTGPLKDKKLTLERTDAATKESQRLVWTLLHANRLLYDFEVKTDRAVDFARAYRVGATKEGVPFAGAGNAQPECIVSGGQGTIKVTYQGATYHVCCSGCQAEFNENPGKYIRELEARKAKK